MQERFFATITNHGLQVRREIEGEGNCMFAALVDQLERVGINDFNPRTLRLNIVEFLRRNPRMSDGTELFSFVSGDNSWEEYLSRMSHQGTWGDHLVLRAASEMLKMQIGVISSVSDRPVTIHPSAETTQCPKLLLEQLFELHYTNLEEAQHQADSPSIGAAHWDPNDAFTNESVLESTENTSDNVRGSVDLQSQTVSMGKPHEGPDDP
ncbi:OTU domain-containing protein DDB_G0284757-like [Lineus longissimus]|uniref:OTU domain-containing protein DDB_G0284757-like n=1 Tax=Lineus longissimus TaxID=88925 RepID=UPI00315D0870